LPALALVLAASTLGARACPAQETGKKEAPPPAKKLLEVPEPEDVTLETQDGVELHARYYPGNRKKDSVPIICLHGYRGDRSEFEGLADYLQKIGHAVIVPDLRGHGQSTRRKDGVPLDAATLRAVDFKNIVQYDVETTKAFLTNENNQGRLNIDKLCVIGAELGAILAANWAMLDWSWPPLAYGKQGQDVKALVLISPAWAFKGVNMSEAMASDSVRRDLSLLLIVGKGSSKHVREANRLFKSFERFHPAPPEEEKAAKKDLFLVQPDTKLQGTKLLGENLNLEETIARFVEFRLVNKQYPWTDRRLEKKGSQ